MYIYLAWEEVTTNNNLQKFENTINITKKFKNPILALTS